MREPAAGEVHVWQAGLAASPEDVARLQAGLSDDERARAARFLFDRHRRRFVVARATLRAMLARYTGRPAASLVFEYGPHGKPALVGAGDVRFIVAHWDELAVYAVTRGAAVGVDVERLREVHEADRIAERFFSVPERDELRALPEASRSAGFFTCWTRKEAYVKARGEGLAHPLDAFAVSATPSSPARLSAVDPDALEGAACRVTTAPWPLP